MPWGEQKKISLTPSLMLWPAASWRAPNLNYRSAQLQSPISQPPRSLLSVTVLLRGAERETKILNFHFHFFSTCNTLFYPPLKKNNPCEQKSESLSLLSNYSVSDILFSLHISHRLLETVLMIRVLFLPWSTLGRQASLVNSDLCAF